MTTPKSIAFMGPDTVSPRETELLEALGAAIAGSDHALHTTPARGANAAVATGYRATSGRPAKFHTKKLNTAAPWLIAYGETITTRVLDLEPSPVNDDWVFLHTEDDLETFVECIFGILAQDGKAF